MDLTENGSDVVDLPGLVVPVQTDSLLDVNWLGLLHGDVTLRIHAGQQPSWLAFELRIDVTVPSAVK